MERRLSNMENEFIYEKPKIELILFVSNDIMTISDGNDIGQDDGMFDGEWMKRLRII